VDGDGLDLCGGVEALALGGPWDRRAEAVVARVEAMRRERAGARVP
jgi:hypothetical protein